MKMPCAPMLTAVLEPARARPGAPLTIADYPGAMSVGRTQNGTSASHRPGVAWNGLNATTGAHVLGHLLDSGVAAPTTSGTG